MAFIVLRWPNEQRIRHLRPTLGDFLFVLPEGLSSNEAIFLGQTPTASEGALLCDFLPQLHGALFGWSSLLLRRHFQLERSKGHIDYSDKRCSLA